ncbi:O-antigen ligase family protein [Erwinia sp. CGal63]|uniref:O-antigen ligase family protein n=1 Tax=Erwinia sp. CGal63 TaxID=2919889 RepID=UPI00300A2A2C
MYYLDSLQNCARKEQITRIVFSLSLVLLLLIVPFGYVHEKASRISFYLCSYLCALGIVINFRDIRSTLFTAKIIIPGLLLALMYTVWSSIASYHKVPDVDNGLLFTPAKRWFLGTLIALFTLWGVRKEFVSKKLLYKLTWVSLGAAFILSSVYGIWQHINGVDRIVLGINRATMTAYAYSALALVMMTMLNQIKNIRIRFTAIICTCLLSIYVILLTETRSAMFIHTLLSLAILVNALWQGKAFKPASIIAILLAVTVIAIFSKNIIYSRFDTTQQEITRFSQGDDHTSLGSRFTLWKSGLIAIQENPLGETQTTRNTIIRNWININQPGSFALEYIDVHLHNEFLQFTSLFGIFGFIILLFFFSMLILNNGLEGVFNNPVSIIALSGLLYGMTDVLLTSVEYITLFSTLILLASVNSIEEKKIKK